MGANGNPPSLYLLLASAAVATLVVHLSFVPEHFPEDPLGSAPYLLVGWLTFAMAFYVAGRLLSSPGELPSMRAADIGVGLFLVSLILAGGLDALGFPPVAVLEAYVLPAVGIYAGLALVGWSIGQRTKAINRIAGGD